MRIDVTKFTKLPKFDVLTDCMLVCVCMNINEPEYLYYSIKEVFLGRIMDCKEDEEIISYAQMDHL